MIDFGSIIGLLFELIQAGAMAALGVAVPFAINWFVEKTNVDKLLGDDITRNYLYDVTERAIAFGRVEVAEQVEKLDGKLDLGIQNQLVEVAIGYVLDSVPDALEKFGINTPDAVRNLVTARLSGVLGSEMVSAPADPIVVAAEVASAAEA